MSLIRTSNPVLTKEDIWAPAASSSEVMTVQGAATKSIFVVLVAMATAGFTWTLFFRGGIDAIVPLLIGGFIGGSILGCWNAFRGDAGPITTTVYAGCEGLVLGGLSALVETKYKGIPFQAVALTFGTLFALLAAYKARIVRATEGFRTGVIAATSGVCIVYMIDIVLMLFGMRVPFIHETGPIGIAVSVVIVGIAALNLVLDFDLIEQGARYRAPKRMEWYAAFGLLVTLVWLYLEILDLLMKLQGKGRRTES